MSIKQLRVFEKYGLLQTAVLSSERQKSTPVKSRTKTSTKKIKK